MPLLGMKKTVKQQKPTIRLLYVDVHVAIFLFMG